MKYKTRIIKGMYHVGPLAGTQTMYRSISAEGVGYTLQVVKTSGLRTYAVVFASTQVAAGLRYLDAMATARRVLATCAIPHIDALRKAAGCSHD